MGKRWLVFATCLCMALCLPVFTVPPRVHGMEIYRLSLEDASSLGTTIAADSGIKQEGDGSIRISTAWPTVICLGVVDDLNVENARLVYRAKVRSEALDGAAFLEMWCQVAGGQYFSRDMKSVVKGSTDWKTLQTPFFLRKGQRATKAFLNIVINGKGTIWVDDLRLLREPL